VAGVGKIGHHGVQSGVVGSMASDARSEDYGLWQSASSMSLEHGNHPEKPNDLVSISRGFCDNFGSTDYPLYKCVFSKAQSLCFNCLLPGHRSKQCKHCIAQFDFWPKIRFLYPCRGYNDFNQKFDHAVRETIPTP